MCVLVCRGRMNVGTMRTLENLAQLHRACRQLHSLAYGKVRRTQWKPVLSSACPMCPIQLHPLFWQRDPRSQFRLLSTKEVINSAFSPLPRLPLCGFLTVKGRASAVCRRIFSEFYKAQINGEEMGTNMWTFLNKFMWAFCLDSWNKYGSKYQKWNLKGWWSVCGSICSLIILHFQPFYNKLGERCCKFILHCVPSSFPHTKCQLSIGVSSGDLCTQLVYWELVS